MIQLQDKNILVMGASGFLGRIIASRLSELGATLLVSGRSENALADTLSLLKGSNHHVVPFDVTNLDSAKDFVQSLLGKTNKEKLSGMVYCTGLINTLRPLKTINADFLHEMMRTNFYGFVELARHFSDKRVCSGGSIVAISSVQSTQPDKGQLAYAASKAALDSSVMVLAKELHGKGIRVNSIKPAVVANIPVSELHQAAQSSVSKMQMEPIAPECIADQVAFLLSDLSSGVTGQCLDVKGYLP